jgi:hypothetical protein
MHKSFIVSFETPKKKVEVFSFENPNAEPHDMSSGYFLLVTIMGIVSERELLDVEHMSRELKHMNFDDVQIEFILSFM